MRYGPFRWTAVLRRTGARDSAEAILDEVEPEARSLMESPAEEFFPELWLMAVGTIRGNTGTAVEGLEAAVDDGVRIPPWLQRVAPPGPLPDLERLHEQEGNRRIESRLSAVHDSMRDIVRRSGC